MFTCPYCHKCALSPNRKLYLGPAVRIRCRSCQKKVSVSWWTTALFAVVIIVFTNLGPRLSLALEVLLFLALSGAYLYVHQYFVPIVGRDT